MPFLIAVVSVTECASRSLAPSYSMVHSDKPEAGLIIRIGLLLGGQTLWAEEEHEHEYEHEKGSPNLIEGFKEHLHNKMVHFPIALGLTAFLFLLLSYWKPSFRSSSEFLVWLAALSGVFAVITGLLQEGAFEGTPKEVWVERHEILGIATTLSLFIWGSFFRFKPLRRWAVLWGIFVSPLISVTGYLGGLIAHG